MLMDQHGRLLIVGAGPTGLAGALLSKRGIESRVIAKLLERSPHSKAFGVNPRTLELLEGTGMPERLLESGRRMQGLNLWRKGKHLVHLGFSVLKHRYPFMLIHSQSKTELLLAETLTEAGGRIERGVECLSVENATSQCLSRLRQRIGNSKHIFARVPRCCQAGSAP